MEKQHSQAFLQQRKLLVFLPIVVVPFLSIFFYLFGGGKSIAADEGSQSNLFGLNVTVPTASTDNKIYSSKLEAYQQITTDSVVRKKRSRFSFLESGMDGLLTEDTSSMAMSHPKSSAEKTSAFNYDLNRNRKQQLESPENSSLLEAQRQIEKADKIASANRRPDTGHSSSASRSVSASATTSGDAINQKLLEDYEHKRKQQEEIMGLLKKKLEQTDMTGNTMQPVYTSEFSESEAQPTNNYSAKKNTLKVKLEKEEKPLVTQLMQNGQPNAWATNGAENIDSLTLYTQAIPKANNGFYSLDKVGKLKEEANSIMAAIHHNQTIVAGSTVKMRLQNDIQIGRTIIPTGSFIFGVCSITEERLKISINSIHYREILFPVELSVYDLDGIEGLFIPGSLVRTTTKQGASQGLSGVNFIGTSPTVTSQLTQTAIEAGKNIISKKASIIRIKLKSNYQILLKPSQQAE
jgi:conjugative transposon TraM protein